MRYKTALCLGLIVSLAFTPHAYAEADKSKLHCIIVEISRDRILSLRYRLNIYAEEGKKNVFRISEMRRILGLFPDQRIKPRVKPGQVRVMQHLHFSDRSYLIHQDNLNYVTTVHIRNKAESITTKHELEDQLRRRPEYIKNAKQAGCKINKLTEK